VLDEPNDDGEYWQSLLEQERCGRPSPLYLETVQWEVTYAQRAILVDWMVAAAYACQMTSDALFLAVDCLDRFLSAQPAARELLHLVAVTCLWLAAKYEEVQAPKLPTFLLLLPEGTLAKATVLDMELRVLRTLGYQLTLPTAKTFLRLSFQRLGEVAIDRDLYFLAGYLCECSLLEYSLLHFLPSEVASASFALAHVLLHSPLAGAQLERATGYSAARLKPCMAALAALHTDISASPNIIAVRDKYYSGLFACVAQLPPLSASLIDYLR
jgi:cyclin A